MDLRTFQASTMSEALADVKSTMGPGAVILHTRTFFKHRWLGLRRQEVVEITAGRGLRVPDRNRDADRPSRDAVRAHRPASRQVVQVNASLATRAISERPLLDRPCAAPSMPPGRQFIETPAAQGAAMVGIAQDMTTLKAMVNDLVKQSRQKRCPEVPQELFEHYNQLIQNQVAEELATEMIKTLHRSIRPEHMNQADFVREKLADQIERMLPSSGPIVRTKAVGPHVVALIGPTGVGKTTTIAKLAANLQLREKRRVGLITIDTYRIAAIDQLRKYAEIIGSPLRVVGTAEDLTAAIQSMADCDFVLIDTAGRSPKDTLKLNELKNFLVAANPDEVHLVLSTTASEECVELAINRFAEVRIDKIIFTKLDEAAHVGIVLNVIKKVNKTLSYVTTGQDVPDDIEVGKGRKLAQLILGIIS
ncbi:MAG: flagellar biosynthesis protein FlhF [Planctomycetota bacterium]|nr:flagellar biosynthesis protein FlhF [Planctomycetota bacterium]